MIIEIGDKVKFNTDKGTETIIVNRRLVYDLMGVKEYKKYFGFTGDSSSLLYSVPHSSILSVNGVNLEG